MTFRNTDELRAFLKTIKTYEQFWDAKEPDFWDVRWKQVMDDFIAQGANPDEVLIGLKNAEVSSFSSEFDARKSENLS